MMGWLAPMTGLIAAAVAVPALVVLYFLKLKRREVLISSTLLWKRAVQDLRVNAPFRWMRWNILFFLQLAALGTILAALGRPVLSLASGPARRLVIILDHSASMNSSDVRPSRLAEAKRQARLLVQSLRSKRSWYLADESDQAMVIAFAGRAKVLSNWTADQRQLEAAIEAVTPTDGPSRLAEAVAVARAFATPAGAEDKGRTAETPATLELFSDGRIADLDQVALAPGELVFHRVGFGADNVAVVAAQARRSYEQPDRLDVFAGLANFGERPVSCEVELAIDGRVRAVRTVRLPARSAGRGTGPAEPGRAAVSFLLAHEGGGVLSVRLVHEDLLGADNAARVVLEPPRRLAAALVTEGNEPLALALRATPLVRVDVLKPAEFDRLYPGGADTETPYGLIVLDRHGRDRLPRSNYLAFGPPPGASGCAAEGELKDQAVGDWQDKHPALVFVNLQNVFAAKAWKLRLPRDAAVLAEFEDGPALALVRRESGLYLVAGFDVLQSNWPFDAGFVMFCYNVVGLVASELGEAGREPLRSGEPIVFQAAPGRQEAVLYGPGLAGEKIASDASGLFRFPATDRAGEYRLVLADGTQAAFAVNLLSERESDVAPADELVATGQVVKAAAAEAGAANREVWPLLVGLCLALVCLEWLVYNLKARI